MVVSAKSNNRQSEQPWIVQGKQVSDNSNNEK